MKQFVYNVSGDALQAWQALDGNEQYNLLLRVVWAAKRAQDARGRAGMGWIKTTDDAHAVAAAAWVRLQEKGITNAAPLIVQIWRALSAEAVAVDRSERRQPAAIEDNIIDIYASPMSARESDTLTKIITREEINEAAADDLDRAIISGIEYGYTLKEIAADLDINAATVTRRLQAIRARHAEQARQA